MPSSSITIIMPTPLRPYKELWLLSLDFGSTDLTHGLIPHRSQWVLGTMNPHSLLTIIIMAIARTQAHHISCFAPINHQSIPSLAHAFRLEIHQILSVLSLFILYDKTSKMHQDNFFFFFFFCFFFSFVCVCVWEDKICPLYHSPLCWSIT